MPTSDNEQTPCSVLGCAYKTPAIAGMTPAMILEFLKLHVEAGHREPTGAPSSQPAGHRLKAAAPPRPEADEEMTEGDWQHFTDKWGRYKRVCMPDADDTALRDNLVFCCSKQLGDSLWRNGQDSCGTEEEMLKAMKDLAVRKQNRLVTVFQFQQMKQNPGETAGAYTARLKGMARTCNFSLPDDRHDYTDEMVTNQLIQGLADPTIQEQVLARQVTDKENTLASTLKYIQAKEAGKQDARQLLDNQQGVCKVTEYQRSKSRAPEEDHRSKSSPPDDRGRSHTTEDRCRNCGKRHGASRTCPAFGRTCRICGKYNHFETVCRSRRNESGGSRSNGSRSNSRPGGTAANRRSRPTHKGRPGRPGTNNCIMTPERSAGTFCGIGLAKPMPRPRIVHHNFHQTRGWVAEPPQKQPHLAVRCRVDRGAHNDFGMSLPRHERLVRVQGLTDTGAQMCVAGPDLLASLDYKKGDLIGSESGISGADNESIPTWGSLFLHIETNPDYGPVRSTKAMVYISPAVNTLFLSRATCVNLKIINAAFPRAESRKGHGGINTLREDPSAAPLPPPETKEEQQCNSIGDSCTCTRRTTTPDPPELRYPATKENVAKIKAAILKHYASSCFNQCETQPLPLMTTAPPLRLNINPEAKPVACHKPRPVPIHWQKQVKADLDRDVRLGVIEKVPMGTTARWCAPMVLVAKHTGDPRRTADYTEINKHSVRQTHPTTAPYLQAASIPANTVRTVLDAWQGFHSVPIEPADVDYTQFITPWGRYRYLTVPQGFLAAGDGYTNRFDAITEGMDKQTRCIDDTALWDDDIEGCFKRTCDFLTRCGQAGIVFNKKKFQFAQQEIDFLGFRVTQQEVKPGTDFVQAVRDFPRPRDITGIRSFFGLVNQLAFAFAATATMEPFKRFLSPDTEFGWTDELQTAFDKAKEHIIGAIHAGVKIYDPRRTTALLTDWSKTGIGHVLMQKTCECPGKSPRCCSEGWQVTCVGSRFNTPAESRYHPVEGEMLGVAWALNKTRFFTRGHPDLTVVVDHKPLLKILGDKRMSDIENPRIHNLKEKTLGFRFGVIHIPGKDHHAADSTSRQPTGPPISLLLIAEDTDASKVRHLVSGLRLHPSTEEAEESATTEQHVAGRARANLEALRGDSMVIANLSKVRAVTWKRLEEASAEDKTVAALRTLIQAGAPEQREDWPEALKDFATHREALTITDNVVLFKGRPLIPPALRKEVIDLLHQGHQGITAMTGHAEQTVYWPGYNDDIIRRRLSCTGCDEVAPSQPAAPPTPLPVPEHPFQMIAADYFQYAGNNYFVIVDRYSKWLSIFPAKTETAAEFISTARTYFSTFGIAAEISTDGGPQFTAEETQAFLTQFGVHHRLSSAYMPHSNQVAEGAVKIAKRMIRENTSRSGSLDTDKFIAARLAYLNTPDRDTKMSPARVVFGRTINELLPSAPGDLKLHPEWRITMEQREKALARRHASRNEALTEHTKNLPPLANGTVVLVQNQTGNTPKRWSRSGVIVEARDNNQYLVKLDGSGRATLRNRRFLRRIVPYTSQLSDNAAAPTAPTATTTPPAPTAPRPALKPTLRRSDRTSKAPNRLRVGFVGPQPLTTQRNNDHARKHTKRRRTETGYNRRDRADLDYANEYRTESGYNRRDRADLDYASKYRAEPGSKGGRA
jgi:hypothetical protein